MQGASWVTRAKPTNTTDLYTPIILIPYLFGLDRNIHGWNEIAV